LTDQAIAEMTEEQGHFLWVVFKQHDFIANDDVQRHLAAHHDQEITSLDFKNSKKIHCDKHLHNDQFNTRCASSWELQRMPRNKNVTSSQQEE